jgi:hypothetical protein
MLCSRQSGKSTTSAVLAAHEAVYTPGALVLILSPTLRQSGELFAKVKAVLADAGEMAEPDRDSVTTLVLGNGSRIVSLPGTERTIRGFSAPSLVVIDEAARVRDEAYQGVRPMLAVSGGRLVTLSTPFGKRGWFWHEWDAGDGWYRVKVTAHDVPRIDPTWLEAERLRIGPWWYSQEYLCRFIEPEDQLIPDEFLERAIRYDLEPLFAEGEFVDVA